MFFQSSMFSDQARPDINIAEEELTGKQRILAYFEIICFNDIQL